MGAPPSTKANKKKQGSKQQQHDTSSSLYSAKGVYLHGGVGCGKTFCMNLFHDAIVTQNNSHPWANNTQKIHFHKFMLQIHQAMHMARKQKQNSDDRSSTASESDAILPAVIAETVKQGRLICLDEFQGTYVNNRR
jgi:predicted ATPase